MPRYVLCWLQLPVYGMLMSVGCIASYACSWFDWSGYGRLCWIQVAGANCWALLATVASTQNLTYHISYAGRHMILCLYIMMDEWKVPCDAIAGSPWHWLVAGNPWIIELLQLSVEVVSLGVVRRRNLHQSKKLNLLIGVFFVLGFFLTTIFIP